MVGPGPNTLKSKHLIQDIIFVILDVTDFLVKKQQSLNTGANKKKLLMTSKFMNYNRKGGGTFLQAKGHILFLKCQFFELQTSGDSTLSQ